MRSKRKGFGIIISFILFVSMFISLFSMPLPIAKASPTYFWSTFTIAASGDDVVTLANSTWSNYTSDGNNLWAHSNEYTTTSWLRFEGLSAITDSGGIIDQIILSMYSGDDVGADYTGESSSGGYVSVSAPLTQWNWELTETNIGKYQMNSIASFDGDELSPSGAWYNKTISNTDPRDWYSWSSSFEDVFICYVGGFMQYSPDYTYYRSFTSFDEGHPAKIYVKYYTGEGYEEVLDEFGVSGATYVQTWNNYNIWYINGSTSGQYEDFDDLSVYTETDPNNRLTISESGRKVSFENLQGTENCNLDRVDLTDTAQTFSVSFKWNVQQITYGNHRTPAYMFKVENGANSLSVLPSLINNTHFEIGVHQDDGTPSLCKMNEDLQEGITLWYKMVCNHTTDKLYQYVWLYEPTSWDSGYNYTKTYNTEIPLKNLDWDGVRVLEDYGGSTDDYDGYIDYMTIITGEEEFIDGYVATAPNGTVITPSPLASADLAEDAAEDWDEDYGPVVSISISNIDAVEWVFEGNKRYEFTVVYINVDLDDIEQVGVGFTDEINNFHSVWYDYDANTLTVTSPEDSISGWLNSIEQTSTNVTCVFHIMFNTPIPDSYDVSAYGRIVDTSDSGWTTPEWGEAGESGEPYLFNIYNLGGLSTLTTSGTAGRMTGGDIFELYAADTRTNIAGTEYFDVRDDPLSWYNVLTNEDLLINEMPPDWEFNLPRRTQSITIRLTNNLPEDRTSPQARTYVTSDANDMAYVSYPFSMRLLSDPFLSGDYQIGAELTLPRTLTSDDGILCVQAYMMNPNTTTTTGAFRVRDGSRLEAETRILSDVQFNGNGSWASYNSSASAWKYYSSYDAYTWYNVTVAIDLTATVYDIFIDDVEVVSDLPYRNPAASTAYVIAFSQFVPAAGAPENAFLDFYVDNVRQWTDFDADYGGWAEATMLFKQLQHWSMDFDFFIENGEEYAQGPSATPAIASDDYSDHGYLEFGWDVMLNETWINDFLVARVNITDGKISGKNDWIKFNVTWYSQGIYVKNDFLYGLFEGYSLFPGSSKDTSGFHWDIWFNRANASTIVGARVNTEYFGMSDKSVWWAVWSSKWQPMRTEVSDSMIFVDLKDAESVIHSVKDVLFVRSSVKVYRTSDSTFSYKVLNIGSLDFMVARDTMSGIDTPPVRETKVPDVVSGFLGSALGGIFSAALKRLGNTLAGFGIGLFTLSIQFIDNVFAALGYPALVSTIFGWMDSLFSSVPTLLGYGITMIGNIFTLINTSAGNTLTQLAAMISIWVGMYGTMMDMLNGVMTPGFNLWRDLGINTFIQVGAILYPLWLLILGSEKGIQAVIDHLTGVLNIGSFFLNFILNVGGFFMGLLTSLIGAIRG